MGHPIFSPWEGDEAEILQRLPCECGGEWTIKEKTRKVVNGKPINEYQLKCRECNNFALLKFDASAWACKC